MGILEKYGTSKLSSFSDAAEVVYGTGSDGSVTFDGTSTVLGIAPSSSVYTLTRDINCLNMTVNASVRVQPNGYRIFVKNLLTLGNASIIGFTGGSSASGTIKGGSTGDAYHSLGGSNGGDPGYSAIPPYDSEGGINYYKQALNAIRCYSITAGGGPTFLTGGAGDGSPGGGIVICAARYIECTATTTLAKFSAPASVSTANGGGVVLVISTLPSLPANITYDVGGGTFGIYQGQNGTFNYIQAM